MVCKLEDSWGRNSTAEAHCTNAVAIYLFNVNLKFICLKCAEMWHFDISHAITE